MKKVKYEKPLLKRLGYDDRVMGYNCVSGTGFKVGNCNPGNKASSCSPGNLFALACVTGPTPTS